MESERKGGCCLAPRYGAARQMGRIMLKFRPIAPKPAAMAPAPAAAPVTGPAVGTRRGKRKAVGGGGGKRGRKPKKAGPVEVVTAVPVSAAKQDASSCRNDCEKEKSLSSRSSSSSGLTSVDSSPPPLPQQHQLATLPLMSVTPAEDKHTVGAAAEEPAPVPSPVVRSVPPRVTRPAASPAAWVMVEEVTPTWADGEAPSSAACAAGTGGHEAPAFVSDLWGRVTWMNAAFCRTVSAADDSDAPVALAGAFPAWGTCPGFTCRVRVRHSSPRRVGASVVAPCDVWRLDAGGCYLWRLDLQAALTLGGVLRTASHTNLKL